MLDPIPDIPAGTVPMRRWDIHSRPGSYTTPTATVGFAPSAEGGRIRIEMAKRLSNQPDHKDRRVVARHLRPSAARDLGTALIAAADQAERGEAVYTKRST